MRTGRHDSPASELVVIEPYVEQCRVDVTRVDERTSFAHASDRSQAGVASLFDDLPDEEGD